jgi:dihydroflavonol-4-reductase
MGTMGLRSPISRENAWTSTMFHWFDSSKAQRELDFKPRPAQMAVSQSVKWIKENGYLKNS